MKNYTIVAIACLVVGGCGSTQETFATQVKARGDAYDGIASSWAKGDAMIRQGNDLVKQGREEYEKGRLLAEQGNQHVTEGNALVQQGHQMKVGAEMYYQQLGTTPYQGPVVR